MFLETICIQQGEIKNREGHEHRMRQTAAHFGFKTPQLPNLCKLLPEELREEKVKCRVIYREEIEEITFERYLPKRIESLKLMEATVDYPFKFADRSPLNVLLAKKGDCDEILITRDGFISDTSFSNVVFSKGKKFYTPENPLLNGTKRQLLLRKGVICEKKIHQDDLREYDRIYLINAMLDLEDGVSLPVEAIID